MTITLFGALMAMAIAIILILLKVSPPYSMIFGALIGGIIGGGVLTETITIMINGASGIVTVVIRILVAVFYLEYYQSQGLQIQYLNL